MKVLLAIMLALPSGPPVKHVEEVLTIQECLDMATDALIKAAAAGRQVLVSCEAIPEQEHPA